MAAINMESTTVRKGFGITPTAPFKVRINIGAGFDIPTGDIIVGLHGESIINGGLSFLTGMTGVGNSFKSTILHYHLIQALNRMYGSFAATYDTEINIEESHLKTLVKNTQEDYPVEKSDFLSNGGWVVTDKTVYPGNKWWDTTRDFLKEKIKSAKEYAVTTPFPDRSRDKHLKILVPTPIEIDSFSEFTTEAIEKMQDESELGQSGQNAVSLKQGQHKNQFLMEVPGLAGGSYSYFLLTSHIGEEYALDPRKPPTKKLAEIPQGKKLKGVPEKFTYVMHNCWWAIASSSLINQGTKEPEYPRDENDDKRGDTDLKVVTLKQIRGKSGLTGITVELVVSQTLGVLPSLSEFHHIKSMNRFGIDGSLQTYNLTLLPDVKLTRKSVRSLLSTNRKLARAVNITNELCQMHEYWFHIADLLMTPEELYKAIIDQGYDWDMILSKTRGYWILEEDERPLGLFLSTIDLLKMARGKYHPYWLESDKKTIKKAYINKLPRE